MYAYDYEPNQKVYFLGRKARVLGEDEFWPYLPAEWALWAVPIYLKNDPEQCVIIAHAAHLVPRG